MRERLNVLDLDNNPAETGRYLESMELELRKTGRFVWEGLGTFRLSGGGILFTAEAGTALELNGRYAGYVPLLIARAGAAVEEDSAFLLPSLMEDAPATFDSDWIVSNDPELQNEPEPIQALPTVPEKKVEMAEPAPAKAGVKRISWKPAAALLIVISGVWLIIQQVKGPEIPQVQTESRPAGAPDLKIAETNPVIEKKNSPAAEPDVDSSNTSINNLPGVSAPEPTVVPGYGIQLPADSTLNTFYTIVVHSLDKPEKAQKQAAYIQSLNLRPFIGMLTINEAPAYRVSIGQFQSVADAVSAVGQLPEPFQKAYFIKRYPYTSIPVSK